MKKMMICMITVLAALVMNANEAPANTLGRDNSVESVTDVVKAHSTDTYRIYCTRGEDIALLVIGNGDTDLDLYVYDENCNLITSDSDPGDCCIVAWKAMCNGYYEIRLRNRGGVSNRYVLMKG